MTIRNAERRGVHLQASQPASPKLTADVYDQPAPVLDFGVSQKIGRHTTVKLFAKNLLDPRIERTYGKDSELLYDSYKRGRTFGVTLSYDF
jgi:outer membrane receptor protein involved in Fe transport